jgi:methionyl-tRNA synthetase
VLAEVIRAVATVLQPFMPDSMARMLDQLAVPAKARGFAALAEPLTDGAILPAPQGIFPRYVDEAA